MSDSIQGVTIDWPQTLAALADADPGRVGSAMIAALARHTGRSFEAIRQCSEVAEPYLMMMAEHNTAPLSPANDFMANGAAVLIPVMVATLMGSSHLGDLEVVAKMLKLAFEAGHKRAMSDLAFMAGSAPRAD